jgi:hypothetical protein
VAFDIHKKLILGALGCGGLFVLGLVALLLFGRKEIFNGADTREVFMLGESAPSWDSLITASPHDLVSPPALAAWHARGKAPGFLHILVSKSRIEYPTFGDTFPEGSPERKDVVLTAQRVAVWSPKTRVPIGLAYPPAYIVFFRARIFLAAADDWSRHGDLPEGELAMDSVFALARVSLQSSDLERMMAGARIERDALDLLSRDTLLAGGGEAARNAGAAVPSWARFAQGLGAADHWMMAAGASTLYADSLAALVADSSLPVSWRATAAEGIAAGWVFNSVERERGIARSRTETLERIQRSRLPDSVTAAIHRATAMSAGNLMDRFRASTDFRASRIMLFRP